ncbi:SURF1 family protein [Alkalimonas sp. MEB108]|uniref:SURF1-like protein n=1 Tax=Alkalimonas cellulosilytica TaxID=3058395 RepID=A0ABU7J6S7_9GAMM|nr:SURF1 family protein [Alkalimonas sp. MEB108]MEE2002213.1 SURF1 family protein [Alkalimonas sp. MEB108]
MQFRVAGTSVSVHPVWFLITLTVFAVLIKLGWWQLSRASEKASQLQQLASWQAEGPLNWQQLRQLPLPDVDLVQFADEGRWLAPMVWLQDNKMVQGRIGYDVIIPVQFNRFEPPVLVNLGWVEAPPNRTELPELTIPEHLPIRGVVRTSFGSFRLGQNLEEGDNWPMRIQQVELDSVNPYLPEPALAAVIYQMEASPFLPHYQPVVMPPEKHRGYAIQWFLLAVAVLGVALAASLRKEDTNE